ncbi:MAG TPA: ATP-binding cassette domain-containing protein [Anaerolineae bacterium]|nr:ATP-binding cassette domain-containing protein [Anaerolineae bacterium]HMR63731.1 ATP-binding cassette domain-containing protein [Anaerolineae bacterium]
MDQLLRVINLSKRFGRLHVLEQINFEVYPGEVLGLAGRTGAGKTVLAMLIAGLHPPSDGDIYYENRRLPWPFQAHKLGIGVIHQEPSLAENLDVVSNIFLGHELGWPGPNKLLKLPNQWRMYREATRVLQQLEANFNNLDEKVSNLTSEQRQLVAIARVMTHPAKLIFVDEPTVLLSYSYQQRLLSLIQSWQQRGISVIFSSKNLEHLFAVTDRIITLRKGRQVAHHRTDETSREEIVAELVGTSGHQQLTPAIWALDNYYRAREQAEKLRHQQTLLEQNLVERDTLNQQLVDQLAEQIEALDQANMALQAAQRRLMTEREQERKHLARELHDQVIQDLLSLNYQLEDIESSYAGNPNLIEEVEEVRTSIRLMVDDLRRICGNLRPPTIDSLGLGAALQSYTRDWSERTGIEVNLSLDANLGRLPEPIELSIFRIIQEGLSNARKHAQASSVEICLKHTSPRTLMISVSDNGRGLAQDFDLATWATQEHYGLLGISERVALLGGRLNLQNRPQGGMILQVEIPHPRVGATIDSFVV